MLRLPDKPEELVVYIVGVLTILSFCWTTLCSLWKWITKCRFRFVFASMGDSRGNKALCIQTKYYSGDINPILTLQYSLCPRNITTILIFRNGVETTRLYGAVSKQKLDEAVAPITL